MKNAKIRPFFISMALLGLCNNLYANEWGYILPEPGIGREIIKDVLGVGNGDQKNLMPTYSQLVTVPKETYYAVVRYYSPLDPSKLLPAPSVTTESGAKLVANHLFSYQSDQSTWAYAVKYLNGQLDGGYEQFAQYYYVIIPPGTTSVEMKNTFQETGYTSITFYTYVGKVLAVYKDESLSVSSGVNPFIAGNPSIFSYTDNVPVEAAVTPSNIESPVAGNVRNVPIYRADRNTSKQNALEDIAADGCSVAYLMTSVTNPKPKLPNYMLLKMRLPKTFIQNKKLDEVFGYYNAREISVSSTMTSLNDDKPTLDFWTVNANMLSKTVDSDGMVYVMTAPRAFVSKLVAEQKLPPRTAPTLRLGDKVAYVIGKPTWYLAIRYRDPAADWIGSPANATCLDSPGQQAIKPYELGEFTPELRGADTLEMLMRQTL